MKGLAPPCLFRPVQVLSGLGDAHPPWGGPFITEPTVQCFSRVKASSPTPRHNVQSGNPVTSKVNVKPSQQPSKNPSLNEAVYETMPQQLWTQFCDTDPSEEEVSKGRSWFELEKSGATL